MARRPTSQQKRQIDALIARLQPEIRQAFEAAIYGARAAVDFNALVSALQAGNVARAVELVTISHAALFPLEEAVRNSYVAGAFTASTTLPRGMQASFTFNGNAPRAEAYLRGIGSTLIQDIRDNTNAASREYLLERVRQITATGQADNRALRSVAQEITGKLNRVTGRREGGVLGLTRQQADAVLNARADLLNLDRRYFTRELRDRRFDALVRKSIADGKPLARADIDRIAGRYNDRMLAYRGRVIAKDQSFTASASGRREAMAQIGERPDIERVEKTWLAIPASKEPRPEHQAMSGTTIPLDEPFDFGDYTLDMPHDPNGAAEHTIGCTCNAVYRAVPVRG